jgi:hypothetical protein
MFQSHKLLVLCLLIFAGWINVHATDNFSGSGWNGASHIPSNAIVWGSNHQIATLQFWSQTDLWASDSLADDSTGAIYIADWWGKATVHTLITDTATAGTGNYPRVRISWQIRDNFNTTSAWITAKTFFDETGADTAQTWRTDTLDFSDPAMRGAYGRFYVDGRASNRKAKQELLTLIANFVKSGNFVSSGN